MMAYSLKELLSLRRTWLKAALEYYWGHGNDTGLTDSQWDLIGRTLWSNRELLPHCKILNDKDYGGGSLCWVSQELYVEMLCIDPIAGEML